MASDAVRAVDLFCGAGGLSTGVARACEDLGLGPQGADLESTGHKQERSMPDENISKQTIRQRVFERDGYTCQDCGVFVGGRFSDLPTGHMHHIDGDSENDVLNNLITLCHNCHNERHDHYVPDGPENPTVTAHYGEDNPRWNGGRYKAPNGYIYVKRPEHPNSDSRGYVGEHRLVASNKIGRPLKEGEVVHHKNEERTDNHPENLEVLTIGEHMVRHRGKSSDLREPDEPNPKIKCACGCGEALAKYDESGRPREYIHGHNSREQEAPTQNEIIELLAQNGPMKRSDIIDTLEKTESAVKSALKRLHEKGEVKTSGKHGFWKIADGNKKAGDAE